MKKENYTHKLGVEAVENWQDATEALAKAFTLKYFPYETRNNQTFWVGNEIGGVFCVADMFFSIERMIVALKHKVPFSKLRIYYEAELEEFIGNPGKPFHTNFENYVKYGFIGKQS